MRQALPLLQKSLANSSNMEMIWNAVKSHIFLFRKQLDCAIGEIFALSATDRAVFFLVEMT